MDLSSLIIKVKEIAIELTKTTSLEIYFFGSIIDQSQPVADIDILVIYDHSEELTRVKSNFEPVTDLFPIHFVFLNKKEAEFFDFIREVGAERIPPS